MQSPKAMVIRCFGWVRSADAPPERSSRHRRSPLQSKRKSKPSFGSMNSSKWSMISYGRRQPTIGIPPISSMIFIPRIRSELTIRARYWYRALTRSKSRRILATPITEMTCSFGVGTLEHC